MQALYTSYGPPFTRLPCKQIEESFSWSGLVVDVQQAGHGTLLFPRAPMKTSIE